MAILPSRLTRQLDTSHEDTNHGVRIAFIPVFRLNKHPSGIAPSNPWGMNDDECIQSSFHTFRSGVYH
jgi:hypothetical protein